jgi:hypothetical protein
VGAGAKLLSQSAVEEPVYQRIVMEQNKPQQPIPPVLEKDKVPALDADMALFVGKNADYYARKWGKRNRQGKPAAYTWNAAAFLISPVWLVYRKMYRQAAFYLVAAMAIVAACLLLDDSTGEILSRAASYALTITLGLYGNAMYHDHARKTIDKLRSQGLSGATLGEELQRRGGTNPVAAWILVVVMTAVIVLSVV